jgi:dCTP deaminase
MTILSDADLIKAEALAIESKGVITPFERSSIKQVEGKPVISYGVSSYGYDIRCGNEFKIFTNVNTTVVDPKNFTDKNFISVATNDFIIIPPNSFALAVSLEYFKIPRDVIGICLGKSTYARCGIIANITPLEPEWEGYLTIELSNTTPLPAKIYANEGIAQILFMQAENTCLTSYKDRAGKYNGQTGITLPKC